MQEKKPEKSGTEEKEKKRCTQKQINKDKKVREKGNKCVREKKRERKRTRKMGNKLEKLG